MNRFRCQANSLWLYNNSDFDVVTVEVQRKRLNKQWICDLWFAWSTSVAFFTFAVEAVLFALKVSFPHIDCDFSSLFGMLSVRGCPQLHVCSSSFARQSMACAIVHLFKLCSGSSNLQRLYRSKACNCIGHGRSGLDSASWFPVAMANGNCAKASFHCQGGSTSCSTPGERWRSSTDFPTVAATRTASTATTGRSAQGCG